MRLFSGGAVFLSSNLVRNLGRSKYHEHYPLEQDQREEGVHFKESSVQRDHLMILLNFFCVLQPLWRELRKYPMLHLPWAKAARAGCVVRNVQLVPAILCQLHLQEWRDAGPHYR